MKVMIKGTDRNGKCVFIKEWDDVEQNSIGNLIADAHHSHPAAISIEITVAYPDPEVVALKQTISNVIAHGRQMARTPKQMADDLFNTLIIKGVRTDV